MLNKLCYKNYGINLKRLKRSLIKFNLIYCESSNSVILDNYIVDIFIARLLIFS